VAAAASLLGSPFCGAGLGPNGWISGNSLILMFLGLRRGGRKLSSNFQSVRLDQATGKDFVIRV
jgi:hypothetical protein